MTHNPFWQYSLTVYQRPAVAELCLQLQDDYGVDINMLLCAAWLASIGQPLTQPLLQSLLAESKQWQQHCVQPLRQARRFLKNHSSAELYQQAKALELQGEALQQQRLYDQLRKLPLAAAQQGLLHSNVSHYLGGLIANEVDVTAAVQSFCGLLGQIVANSDDVAGHRL